MGIGFEECEWGHNDKGRETGIFRIFVEIEYRGDMMVIGNKTKLFEAGKIG